MTFIVNKRKLSLTKAFARGADRKARLKQCSLMITFLDKVMRWLVLIDRPN